MKIKHCCQRTSKQRFYIYSAFMPSSISLLRIERLIKKIQHIYIVGII